MNAVVKGKFLNNSELPKALIDLDVRRTGLGGSDIAAVLGISPYKSAYEVYEEKVNGYTKDLSDNEKVQSGMQAFFRLAL